MMKSLFSILILTTCFLTYGQNYEEEIAKIIEVVEQSNSCHIVSDVVVYNNATDRSTVMQFKSELRKTGESYRSMIAETEMISNGNLLVVIDHNERVVQLQKMEKMSKDDRAFLQELYELNSNKEQVDSIEFLLSEGDLNTYQLNFSSGEISRIEIVLDVVHQKLSKMSIWYDQKYYPENNYVEMDYSLFSVDETFGKELFSAKDILRKKTRGFELLGSCKNYQLLDYYTP